MSNIIPNITSLQMYISNFENICKLLLHKCPYCGFDKCWGNGYYDRKPDRDDGALNPVSIKRLRCQGCGKTHSLLPECMAKKLWYLCEVLQQSLMHYISGESIRSISKKIKPSRRTIARWINKFKEKFNLYADCLRSVFPELGRCCDFKSFWRKCFNKWSLSKVMLILSNSEIFVF